MADTVPSIVESIHDVFLELVEGIRVEVEKECTNTHQNQSSSNGDGSSVNNLLGAVTMGLVSFC